MSSQSFRLFRRRVGHGVRAWPMLALLVLVVVVAIGCVLWFMREAMQNERMAVRQTLADAYRSHLSLVQVQTLEQWKRRLEHLDGAEPCAARFSRCVRDGLADSIICFDEQGRPDYPRLPSAGDAGERSLSASADLLRLEKLADRSGDQFRQFAGKLEQQVSNYDTEMIPSAQRRFIMHELQRLDSGALFPTLDAEELAARYLETGPTVAHDNGLQATSAHEMWSALSPSRRVLALFTTNGLRKRLEDATRDAGPSLPNGVRITVNAPGEDAMSDSAVATASLGPALPGWRLSLSVNNQALFDTEAEHRAAQYLVIGSIVIAAMLVLAIFVARGFGRQLQLARLKNDLVATVSHELKTPLTAMRALVDTLLENDRLDQKTTREYLSLLATENTRLSRLIDNFLTFSRLERNKFKFAFARVRPRQIVEQAVAAMGERAHAAGCTVESQVMAGIPEINGDADALTTALLNLLDNAWKYTGDQKRIVVRADARNGHVDFAVEDNGIGLSARDRQRVFDWFYQADQRLARTAGGCGLGLSIVQAIVEAHHGRVRVDSEPGRGSTFTIEIPAVRGSTS